MNTTFVGMAKITQLWNISSKAEQKMTVVHNQTCYTKSTEGATVNVEILAIHLIWRYGDEQLNTKFKTANIFVHAQSNNYVINNTSRCVDL